VRALDKHGGARACHALGRHAQECVIAPPPLVIGAAAWRLVCCCGGGCDGTGAEPRLEVHPTGGVGGPHEACIGQGGERGVGQEL
jgi:hypothetical protein